MVTVAPHLTAYYVIDEREGRKPIAVEGEKGEDALLLLSLSNLSPLVSYLLQHGSTLLLKQLAIVSSPRQMHCYMLCVTV